MQQSYKGDLRGGLRWTKHIGSIWCMITFLHRKQTILRRSAAYELLKRRATVEMKDMCEALETQSLFALWWISRREAPPAVHLRNAETIERAIRSKGFTCLPERRLVVKVPPNGRASRQEVNGAIKSMFKRSFLHRQLVASVMWSLSIVYTAAPTVGSVLDNTKQYIEILSGNEPVCQCDKYPSSWPRRHGHICMPSWSYTGKYKSAARAVMTRHVKSGFDPEALTTALRTFWMRYFPSGLYPGDAGVPGQIPRHMGRSKDAVAPPRRKLKFFKKESLLAA